MGIFKGRVSGISIWNLLFGQGAIYMPTQNLLKTILAILGFNEMFLLQAIETEVEDPTLHEMEVTRNTTIQIILCQYQIFLFR